MASIDTSQVILPIITTCGVILTAVVTWTLGRVAGYFWVSKQNAVVLAWEDALNKSIQAGASELQEEIKLKGYDHIDVKSQIVAWAAMYAMGKFAPVLKNMGLDLNNPEVTRKYITDELNRKFPLVMGEFANSPTTPEVFAPNSMTTQQLNESELNRIQELGR